MLGVISFLLRIGLSGLVDRTLRHIEAKSAQETEQDAIRSITTVAIAQQHVAEARILADLNRAKFQFPVFWMFAALFIGPLGLWWAAVILDSVFGFPWSVADLPTPQMQEWAGNMITWLFYIGSGAGVVKMLK